MLFTINYQLLFSKLYVGGTLQLYNADKTGEATRPIAGKTISVTLDVQTLNEAVDAVCKALETLTYDASTEETTIKTAVESVLKVGNTLEMGTGDDAFKNEGGTVTGTLDITHTETGTTATKTIDLATKKVVEPTEP
ncbi:MAG: hypothetical protein NC318_11060 [Blautia sp.]|nr:hypothetical protein [Blautia sp.]